MKLNDLEERTLSFYDLQSQLRDHVNRRSTEAFLKGDQARDAIQDIMELKSRRMYMRTKLLESLGGLPSSQTPLNANVVERLSCKGYTLEKIIFQSRPETYVTANLYLPEVVTTPQGAVLFVIGHSANGKQLDTYQNVCQTLVHAGLIVFIIDAIGQGERLSYYDQELKRATVRPATGEHEHVGLQCWPLGQGIARYFIHDTMRAIDYLCTRPEVDHTKIGITGSSGGGTQTMLAMLCEERIAAAAPGTFTSNRYEIMLCGNPQDAEQIWPGMSALGFDHEDALLAFAPKPLLVLAATEDFFPIEGTRRTVARTRRFWDMYEKGDNIELYEDISPHRYSEPLARAAAAFFAKHLLGTTISIDVVPYAPMEDHKLWCTRSGQVRGDFEVTRAVYEENCDYLKELEHKRSFMPEHERRQRANQWLCKQVIASRSFENLNPRYFDANLLDGETITAQSMIWKSQVDLFNHAILFRDERYMEKLLPVTIAIWEGGTKSLQSHMSWIRDRCNQGRIVMVLDVAGVGKLSPHSSKKNGLNSNFGVVHVLTMNLLWLNDSLAAIRTYEILRALDMAACLRGSSLSDLRLYAHGKFSIYAKVAAEIDERARHLEVEQGFGSIGSFIRSRNYGSESDELGMAGLIFPGILQFLDIT